jgi:hypothetical protein
MSDYSSFQQRDIFNNKVFEIVKDFLSNNNESDFNDFSLCVNKNTLEIFIDKNIENTSDIDLYPIKDYIRFDCEESLFEPDCDETYELASLYFFVK